MFTTPSLRRAVRASHFMLLAACLATLFAPTVLIAAKTPYTKIVAFGDSLTDTHNYYAATGQPPAPYYLGRHSNGALWIEHFAALLGMEILPENNYAFAGATSGRENENDNDFLEPRDFPGLHDQVDRFLVESASAGVDPDALHVIWAGANDFVVMAETGGAPGPTIAAGVQNLARAVAVLSQAGARHIMVVNVPDIGLTPLATATGNGAGFSYLVSIYNQNLDLALDQLATAGIATVRVRSDSILQSMVAAPAHYGFTNVTSPFLWVGGNADEFLFWDLLHPTTTAHRILAEGALAALMENYLPSASTRRGRGVVHSLNGLVNASTHP